MFTVLSKSWAFKKGNLSFAALFVSIGDNGINECSGSTVDSVGSKA